MSYLPYTYIYINDFRFGDIGGSRGLATYKKNLNNKIKN